MALGILTDDWHAQVPDTACRLPEVRLPASIHARHARDVLRTLRGRRREWPTLAAVSRRGDTAARLRLWLDRRQRVHWCDEPGQLPGVRSHVRQSHRYREPGIPYPAVRNE